MSDDKFSIDELLGEYSGGNTESFDLDAILGSAPQVEQPPYEPEMEKRRMELIKREIISGDYEHKYLGEDYRDVIDEENRRKEEKARKIAEIAKAMENRGDDIPDAAPTMEFKKAGTASLSENFREALSASENKPVIPPPEEPPKEEPSPKEEAPLEEAASEKKAAVPQKEEPSPKPERKRPRKRNHNKITQEDEDEFQRKYEELTRMGLGVKSSAERRASAASEAFDEFVDEMKKTAGPGRTFSEKAEEDGSGYSDYTSVKKTKTVPIAVTEHSGLVTYSGNDAATEEEIRLADDPLDSITNNSVDKIINEYEKSKTFTTATMKIGDKNGAAAVLEKLMKPDSSETVSDSGAGGELMENMKRTARERTRNVPDIDREKTAVMDMSLNIDDDKIIRDENEENGEEPPENNEKEMLDAIQKRSKSRMKNFKFTGGDGDDTGNDEKDNDAVIEDFVNMDDAASVAEDIARSKASMIFRLLMLIICFILSLYITVSNEMKAPVFEFVSMTEEPSAYLFVNTVLGMLAAFFAYNAITTGVARLVTFKANCDSFAALTSISTILLSMAGLSQTELVRAGILHEYVPLGIGALIFNTVGKLLMLDRTDRNFRYISGDYEHYALFTVKNEELSESFTKGALNDLPALAAMRPTEMISDFIKNSYAPDMSDRFCRMFAPIILIASLVVGFIGGAAANPDPTLGGKAVYIGICSFVGCLCFCSCFSMMLTVNLPMCKAARKYNQVQGAFIGFDAADEFGDTNSILADASQLFPKGSVSLANIKIFSDTRIDEAIVEAASLACRSDSIMKNMFYEIIGGKTEMLDPVESYIYEDSMGLCGWINNKRVLLGNRKLMENHSIDGIPSAAMEKNYTAGGRMIPVYLSIAGELSAMFIINLVPAPGISEAMRELGRSQIKVILRSVDSAVTVERMAQMFEVSPNIFKVLPYRTHNDFEKTTSYTPRQGAVLACSGQFGVFASLVVSARRVRNTVLTGIAIQAVSILLGILLSALLVLFKSYNDLSTAMILMYNLIFTVLYLIVNLFRKV